jgi:hypothetical protein
MPPRAHEIPPPRAAVPIPLRLAVDTPSSDPVTEAVAQAKQLQALGLQQELLETQRAELRAKREQAEAERRRAEAEARRLEQDRTSPISREAEALERERLELQRMELHMKLEELKQKAGGQGDGQMSAILGFMAQRLEAAEQQAAEARREQMALLQQMLEAQRQPRDSVVVNPVEAVAQQLTAVLQLRQAIAPLFPESKGSAQDQVALETRRHELELQRRRYEQQLELERMRFAAEQEERQRREVLDRERVAAEQRRSEAFAQVLQQIGPGVIQAFGQRFLGMDGAAPAVRDGAALQPPALDGEVPPIVSAPPRAQCPECGEEFAWLLGADGALAEEVECPHCRKTLTRVHPG